jgi:ABC-type multidrug transport system permease subunit
MIPQRWQALTQLVAARFHEFSREPEVIFWVYGFPLVVAIGLGFAFSRTEPVPPEVDVQETPDKTLAEAAARHLSDASWDKEKLRVQVLPHDECEKRLNRAETALYLIVHPGRKPQYVYDPARDDSVQAKYWVEALLSRKLGEKIDATTDLRPGSRYVEFLLPGLIGINIMGGGLFGVGFVLVDMRVRKLFKRLLATPMRHGDFLMSLMISRLLFLIPEMASLILVARFWFRVPMNGSYVTLFLIILLGAAAFSGIGLLLGSRTEKTETMSGMVNMIMIPMYIFSGVFFSSKRFPDEAQPFIDALPLTQLNQALREVMLQGASFWEVGWHLLILLAYAVVTTALALWLFRWR